MVQKTLWLIPLMQTIHIICVALVFSSVVMIEFRVLGYNQVGDGGGDGAPLRSVDSSASSRWP